MRKWYVYLLLCDHKTFYVGITSDLKRRLGEHRNKESIFTKKFCDVDMVYAERYDDKYQAAKRERQLKGWSVVKKKLLIEGKLGINHVTELVEVVNNGD
jgi:putative endonuclease